MSHSTRSLPRSTRSAYPRSAGALYGDRCSLRSTVLPISQRPTLRSIPHTAPPCSIGVVVSTRTVAPRSVSLRGLRSCARAVAPVIAVLALLVCARLAHGAELAPVPAGATCTKSATVLPSGVIRIHTVCTAVSK